MEVNMLTTATVRIRLAGLALGVMLAAGNLDGRLAPMQIAAFAGLTIIASKSPTIRSMVLSGFYMGLGYTLPQMAVLRLPAPITAIMMADLLLVILLLSLTAGLLLPARSIGSVLLFAAIATILDWANYSALPMWGTAQSFGRCWSQWPRWIGFVSVTGIGGIVFVHTAISACIGLAISDPQTRRRMVCAAIVLISAAVLISYGQRPHSIDSLRVATVGYDSRKLPGQICLDNPITLEQRFTEPLHRASQQGARLVVFPELTFEVGQSDREQSIRMLCQTAAQYHIAVAAGYYDSTENENRAILIPPTGKRPVFYTKTYLTPFEPFQRGTGRLQRIRLDGVWIGMMICQDDNFTTLSRAYSRLGVGLMAVPTLDWKTVRFPHLQNSIHRAIESDYGLVRAASDGVSAIISPQGTILAGIDHLRSNQNLLVADIPVGQGRTLYSRMGNGFIWICIGLVAVRILWFWRMCPTPRCLVCPVYLRNQVESVSR
jgi:apolipoprotein N-acyltransferase